MNLKNRLIRRIPLAPLVLALGLVSGSAHAALQGRDLNGSPGSFEAYYDTDLNITWTSGNLLGFVTWAAANTWAATLSFTDGVNTYDNWRLPTSDTCIGYNCVGSDMGYLFYRELGISAGQSILAIGPSDRKLDLQTYSYWSGTEFTLSKDYAWAFNFENGYQGKRVKDFGGLALAVSPGDITAVPVPAAAWLLGSGLLGLIGVARRRLALR